MFVDWLSFSTLVAVQFGFAGFLGALAGYARLTGERVLVVASILFYIGASLALPLASSFKLVIWLVSALLFFGFRNTPLTFRMRPRLAWIYVAFAMALIIVWSMARTAQSPFVALGAAAAIAAGLAWRRSLITN